MKVLALVEANAPKIITNEQGLGEENTVEWEISQGNIFTVFTNCTDSQDFHCKVFFRYALKSGKQRAITKFSKEWSIELSKSTI
jgi:hypothetical protein